jgi:hypothetical protein
MTHELSINPFEELNIDSKSLGPPRPCLRIRKKKKKKREREKKTRNRSDSKFTF